MPALANTFQNELGYRFKQIEQALKALGGTGGMMLVQDGTSCSAQKLTRLVTALSAAYDRSFVIVAFRTEALSDMFAVMRPGADYVVYYRDEYVCGTWDREQCGRIALGAISALIQRLMYRSCSADGICFACKKVIGIGASDVKMVIRAAIKEAPPTKNSQDISQALAQSGLTGRSVPCTKCLKIYHLECAQANCHHCHQAFNEAAIQDPPMTPCDDIASTVRMKPPIEK